MQESIHALRCDSKVHWANESGRGKTAWYFYGISHFRKIALVCNFDVTVVVTCICLSVSLLLDISLHEPWIAPQTIPRILASGIGRKYGVFCETAAFECLSPLLPCYLCGHALPLSLVATSLPLFGLRIWWDRWLNSIFFMDGQTFPYWLSLKPGIFHIHWV